jgi:hypothetical protein
MAFRIGPQRRLCIDPPSVDAIVGSRGAQMRVASSVLDPAEEKRGPVRQTRRSCIEDRVRRVRPIGGRQNRVSWMPVEQHFIADG